MVLRNLRGRVDFDRASTAAAADESEWPVPLRECTADLDAYDQALVSAATMLELALPPQPPGDRRFDGEQRRQVERDLVSAGVDLPIDEGDNP